MNTDQSQSAFRDSLPYTLSIVESADASEVMTQGARDWDARARRRDVPALRLHLSTRAAGDEDPRRSSISAARRANNGAGAVRLPTEQLLTSAHEDICRLNEILRSQKCGAVMCGTDGVILSANSPAISNNCVTGHAEALRLDLLAGAAAICAPIFDPEGCLVATLNIIQSVQPDSSEQLLRALAESAARAITERWFRLVHRRQWVVVAMRRNAPGTTMIFAANRDQRIVGADRHARQLLKDWDQANLRPLAVSALFRASPNLLRRRGYGDVSTTLFAALDGEPWIALITPPDTGAAESHQDARGLMHVRPRLDSLIHLSSLPSAGRMRRGLSQGALQRIQEHIEAHLDSALDIDELAAIVRMSASHFTRTFHRSVGMTPHRYVIQNRVMRARELLATSNLPLTEIALSTGFSDQSHFSRRFQEIVGIPPGAFRGHEGRLSQ